MDQQTLADRIEIADLLTTYAHAVDTKDWELWRQVFTDDAHIDYRSAGGIAGTREEVAAWLESTFEMFSMSQHLVANIDVELDGDTARVRAMFYNPMQFQDGPWFHCGGWYNHELVRTSDGWRSRRLVEDTAWNQGLPGGDE